MAKQAHGTGTTRVFVVTEVDQPRVAAYYAWCMASVAIAALPERLQRCAGRNPQPVALLALLGVDERHEGQGLGAALLLDGLSRVASLSDAIGCRSLLVNAESEQARGFYEHLIPEFERSPTGPLSRGPCCGCWRAPRGCSRVVVGRSRSGRGGPAAHASGGNQFGLQRLVFSELADQGNLVGNIHTIRPRLRSYAPTPSNTPTQRPQRVGWLLWWPMSVS